MGVRPEAPEAPEAPEDEGGVRARLSAPAFVSILILALGLRLYGIGTESIWGDEAFTALASQGTIAEIAEKTARDTHPPAYYLGLSLWRAALGDAGDETTDPERRTRVLRGYSVVWSLLGIVLLIELARRFVGDREALLAGAFAACNPLSIYYADEARMYSQAVALSLGGTLAVFHWLASLRAGGGFASWWRAWLAYTLCGAALIYTHYVGVTVLIAQGLLVIGVAARHRSAAAVLGLVAAAGVVAMSFAPWLSYVLGLRASFFNSAGLSWMSTPEWVDYVSFIGREFFWGRADHVHDRAWLPTALVPLGVMALAWVRGRRATPAREAVALVDLAAMLVLPLVVCIGVSLTYELVYYRPRYSHFVLPYFLILLAVACVRLRPTVLSRIAVAGLVVLMLGGVVAQERSLQKHAWREVAANWPVDESPAFYAIFPGWHAAPLNFYLDGRVRSTPQHVLRKLAPLPSGAEVWALHWPGTLTGPDARYRQWLAGLGRKQRRPMPAYFQFERIQPAGQVAWPRFAAERFRAWYRPFDIRGEVMGFSDARMFSEVRFGADGAVVRRSEESAWLRFDELRAGETLVIRASAPRGGRAVASEIRSLRAETPEFLFEQGRTQTLDRNAREIVVPIPDGGAPMWVGWDQSLIVHWVGVEAAASPRRTPGETARGPALRSRAPR